MGFRQLIRNLRLIDEGICPVCKEPVGKEKAQNHCIKIGRKADASN